MYITVVKKVHARKLVTNSKKKIAEAAMFEE